MEKYKVVVHRGDYIDRSQGTRSVTITTPEGHQCRACVSILRSGIEVVGKAPPLPENYWKLPVAPHWWGKIGGLDIEVDGEMCIFSQGEIRLPVAS